jgi:HEAT repeat protein
MLSTLATVSLAAAAGAQPPTPPAVGQLAADVLQSPDVSVRRSGLRALAASGSPEALGPLGVLVMDQDNGIQLDAISAVLDIYVVPPSGRRGRSAEGAFFLAPFDVTPWPAPPQLVSGLTKALADDWPAVRRDAAYALGTISPVPVSEAVAREIHWSLSDLDPSVRLAAARALGRLRVSQAGLDLIGRVNDPVLDVRLASMRSLGDLREPLAVIALNEQFSFDLYNRGSAGRAAIDALARIAHPSSRAFFEAETASGNAAHRRSAYEGLARLGGLNDAAPAIAAALPGEKDREVAAAMAFALTAGGQRAYLETLIGALGDSRTSNQVLEYLVELGPPHASAIAGFATHADPEVRRQVVTALGFIGGAEAEVVLGRANGDADEMVRRASQVALARLRQRDARASATQ